jgi:hypothetical protein
VAVGSERRVRVVAGVVVGKQGIVSDAAAAATATAGRTRVCWCLMLVCVVVTFARAVGMVVGVDVGVIMRVVMPVARLVGWHAWCSSCGRRRWRCATTRSGCRRRRHHHLCQLVTCVQVATTHHLHLTMVHHLRITIKRSRTRRHQEAAHYQHHVL